MTGKNTQQEYDTCTQNDTFTLSREAVCPTIASPPPPAICTEILSLLLCRGVYEERLPIDFNIRRLPCRPEEHPCKEHRWVSPLRLPSLLRGLHRKAASQIQLKTTALPTFISPTKKQAQMCVHRSISHLDPIRDTS